ncbi:transposase [Mesorhizobium sp. C399B]|nr:transposase [Mesorhizobium sp. C399B]WJI72461.1 transposase [Mesorhizobium sp. C399B]
MFIDETGTTTKMTRLRGRCLKGQRLRSKAPFGHWKTQTFIAGLRCHGLTAPFVVDTPMNRRIFETYVETQLAPTLAKGDVHPRQSRCPQEPGRREGHPGQRCMAALPAALQPRSQPVYGWLLRVKGVGSDLVNRSVAAMYTASECATGSLRALMNIRLENRSHSIERDRGASD